MDVYLDAVFYPKIYEIPEIFMQEGWHHEIFDEKEPIRYKGVVYNEMLGAYSSPERILSDNISNPCSLILAINILLEEILM